MLLTAAALILWSISLLQLSRTGLAADDMGYIHTLPLSFWAAMVSVTIASAILWVSPRSHNSLLALQLSLFITMLWLTPLFLGRTVTSTRYLFGLHQLTVYIQRYGQLDTLSQWYHNWPAFNLLETAILELTGIKNPEPLLIWAVGPMQFLVALTLYVLFRRALGAGNHCWVAVWFYILFNWTAQTYFGPQGLATVLFLTLIWFLVMGVTEASVRPSLRLMAILTITGLTITHLLTSLAGIFVVGAMGVIRRRPRLPMLVVLFAVLVAAWMLYEATAFFDSDVPLFVKRALKFDEMWFWNVTRTYLGSEGHQAVVTIRIWYAVAGGLIGLAGLALSRRIRSPRDDAVLVMAVGIVVMVPFQFYGNELFSRGFLFLMPMIAYFAASLLRTRATALLLALLMVVAAPFGIIALHGNALQDDVTPSQRVYWHFLEDKTTHGNLGFGGIPMSWPMGYADRYTGNFDWIRAFASDWKEKWAIRGWVVWGTNNYVGFTKYEDAGFRMLTDYPEGVSELRAKGNEMPDLNLMYDNGEVTAYYHNGEKPTTPYVVDTR